MSPGPMVGFVLALAAGGAMGEVVSEVDLEEEVRGFWTPDLDGDARCDLLLAVWTRESERELRVFLHRPDGRLPPVPDRRIAVKSDIVAFAIADVRAEPGAELLFFTRSGCYSFSTSRQEFAGNARKLFDAPLLCSVPKPKEVLVLSSVADLDGDGAVEVLVPVDAGLLVFGRAAGTESFAERSRLRLRRARAPARSVDGFGSQPSRRPFQGRESGDSGALVVERGTADETSGGAWLKAEHWLPAPFVAELNGDSRADVVALEAGRRGRVLRVFLQGPASSFGPEPTWSGEIDGKGQVWAVDLDGDGLSDLVAAAGGAAGETSLRLYRNRGGSFDVAAPAQVLKFSGYGITPTVVDLDGDRRPELVVSSLSFSVLSGLEGGRMERSLLLFRPDPQGLFARRPVSRIDEVFTAKEFKGLGQPAVFTSGVVAPGSRDVVLVARDGTLTARPVTAALAVADEAAWRFVPRRGILEFRTQDLNGDGRADFVLRHFRSVTVVVSRP